MDIAYDHHRSNTTNNNLAAASLDDNASKQASITHSSTSQQTQSGGEDGTLLKSLQSRMMMSLSHDMDPDTIPEDVPDNPFQVQVCTLLSTIIAKVQ
jgi:hypothetical protein